MRRPAADATLAASAEHAGDGKNDVREIRTRWRFLLYVCRVRSRPARARGGLLVPPRLSPAYERVKKWDSERGPTASRWGRGNDQGAPSDFVRDRLVRAVQAVQAVELAGEGTFFSKLRADDSGGQRRRVSPASEHPYQPPKADGGVEASGCRKPASHQLSRGALLGRRVDGGHGFPERRSVDAPPAQLGGQCPAGQTPPGVPGADPRRGERAVVD